MYLYENKIFFSFIFCQWFHRICIDTYLCHVLYSPTVLKGKSPSFLSKHIYLVLCSHSQYWKKNLSMSSKSKSSLTVLLLYLSLCGFVVSKLIIFHIFHRMCMYVHKWIFFVENLHTILSWSVYLFKLPLYLKPTQNTV